MRFLVILFLIVILASLGSALYYMIRDKGRSERAVKALTVRITLSIVLFILLIVGYATGIIPRGGL
jgi:Na+-driven multidrug efflux pump